MERQPVVVKVSVLSADRSDHIIHQVINQVLKISQRCLLPLLVCQQHTFVLLELFLRIVQLPFHLVVPIFDSLKHTCVLVVLVLADLFFSLSDLLLFEVCQLSEVTSELLELVISLNRVLLVSAIAISAVVAQSDRFLNNLLKG